MSKCWMGLILFNFAEPSLTSFCHKWDFLMPYLRSYGGCPSLFYPLSRYKAYVIQAVDPQKRVTHTGIHAPARHVLNTYLMHDTGAHTAIMQI